MPFGRPRMGFEKTAVRREFRNHKHTVCIGGKTFCVDSDLEERYARYLEILKEAGCIRGWGRNKFHFTFAGAVRGATIYTPDFYVQTNEGKTEFHELKGYLEGSDITKYRRLQEFYPDTILDLILQNLPGARAKSKRVNRIAAARKYCRRVVSFHEVTRGLV
jgi:hypothetical protein